jgi:hypothetical protein
MRAWAAGLRPDLAPYTGVTYRQAVHRCDIQTGSTPV